MRHGSFVANVGATYDLASRLGVGGGIERSFTANKGLEAFNQLYAGAHLRLPSSTDQSHFYVQAQWTHVLGDDAQAYFPYRSSWRGGIQYTWGAVRKTVPATATVAEYKKDVIGAQIRGRYDPNNAVADPGVLLRFVVVGG
jgi:hypothetical protein